MISCGRSGWLAQNFAMLLGIPAHRRSHFERGLAQCSILCLLFRLSSRCFVMRCRTELPWIAWTGPPTASPKCYAKDQARDTLRMGRDWPVKPTNRKLSCKGVDRAQWLQLSDCGVNDLILAEGFLVSFVVYLD